MKYSKKVLDKVKITKLKENLNDGFIRVNDKYDVRFNKKTKKFDICTCKYYNDGKTKTRMCSHMLGVYYHLERTKYEEEIGDDK